MRTHHRTLSPRIIHLAVFGASCLAWPTAAAAASGAEDWRYGTTLNVSAGAASASSETGPIVGGAVGWEVTPWFAVEGNGGWLNRGNGADGFAAELKALVALTPGRAVVPFVAGGIGLYRASFDLSRGVPPNFYRARIQAPGAPGTSVAFTDPSFVIGGGVNIFVTRHVAIRPDLEAKVAFHDQQHYVIGVFAVRAAYHFEKHPVGLSRP